VCPAGAVGLEGGYLPGRLRGGRDAGQFPNATLAAAAAAAGELTAARGKQRM
jgi:hypothetical protein